MTDQLPSKEQEKLLRELRGWHTLKGADCFRQAADEIQRLREELQREVGTRAARVAEIDHLRRRVAELERDIGLAVWAAGAKPARRTAQPPGDGQ